MIPFSYRGGNPIAVPRQAPPSISPTELAGFNSWWPSYHGLDPLPDKIAKVLPGFKSYNANTIEFPVHWGLIEPKEGEFDFAGFDRTVRDIRAHDLRAVALWFGTWKAGEWDHYPDWITSNPKRFPHALDAGGKALRSLSPLGAATLEADRKAFAALMKHLREVDTLAAESPLAENTGDNREVIKPVTSSLAISGNEIRYTFPKLSLTVISLKRR